MMEVDSNNSNAEDSSPKANNVGRRPMNAFLLFCKRHRTIVKEKYPNLENRNITKILGDWWQSLGDEEKANFNTLASEYKEHVMREQPNFRWRKPPLAVPTNTHYTKSKAAGITSANQNNGCFPTRSSPEPNPTPAAESNSGSSSSVPSSSSSSTCSTSTSAPKPIKKRYLAEAAKFDQDESESGRMSPDAANACKALLELAGVNPPEAANSKSENGAGSRSNTSSPPSSSASSTSGKCKTSRLLRVCVF